MEGTLRLASYSGKSPCVQYDSKAACGGGGVRGLENFGFVFLQT